MYTELVSIKTEKCHKLIKIKLYKKYLIFQHLIQKSRNSIEYFFSEIVVFTLLDILAFNRIIVFRNRASFHINPAHII